MINTIQLPGTDLTTSVIGAGCASLGSRISRADGLRALGTALDQGVTWYDVAPAYGAGEAETILGEFARGGRRDRILICSKVGLVPPKRNALLRVVYGVGRPILGMAGGLRRRFRKMPSTRNVSIALSREAITSSLDRSLARLGTDHLDVFALHKPALEDLSKDEILRTLQDIVKSGKARYISVAGSEQAASVALAYPEVYSLLQLADNPTDSPLPRLRAQAGGRELAFVTHSILGVDGAKDRILDSLKRHPQDRQRLVEAGYSGSDEKMVADLLLDRAFASNAQGVSLSSMFSAHHQASNLARASRPANPQAIELVAAIVANKVEITSVT